MYIKPKSLIYDWAAHNTTTYIMLQHHNRKYFHKINTNYFFYCTNNREIKSKYKSKFK